MDIGESSAKAQRTTRVVALFSLRLCVLAPWREMFWCFKTTCVPPGMAAFYAVALWLSQLGQSPIGKGKPRTYRTGRATPAPTDLCRAECGQL